MGLLASFLLTLGSPWMLALFIFFWLCFQMRPEHPDLPPGPFSWPIVGCVFSLQQPLHKHFVKLGARYGPIMCFKLGATRLVVINNSELAKEVLKTNDTEFAFRPPTRYFELFSLGYKNIIFSDPGDSWRVLRKACFLHLFNTNKLNETSSIREAELKTIVLRILTMGEIDVRKVTGEYSANVLSVMLFGKKLEGATRAVEMVEEITSLMLSVNIGELLPLLDRFDFHGVYKKMGKLMPSLIALLSTLMEKRKKQDDGSSKGILDAPLSDTSIMALLIDLMIAGIDTTQTTVEYALAEVMNNSSIMKKAQLEIDSVVGVTHMVKESDISKLPYVQAIFKETLRLHPAGPFAPHYTPKATTISEYHIPAKSRVFVNLWAIGRDPAHWEDPHKFKPERFYGSSINVTGMNFEVIPFSAGRRMCAGYQLAMRSGPLALATFLHAFKWTTQHSHNLEEETAASLAPRLACRLLAQPQPRLMETAYI